MSAERLSKVTFPEIWGLCRAPTRLVHLRDPNPYNNVSFNEVFDWDTLWCDAIQFDQQTIILFGPPLYFTRAIIEHFCQFKTSKGESLQAKCIEKDRICYTIIQVSDWTPELILNPGNVTIKVNYKDTTFDNEHVITTGQKDNPIKWLRDWIVYHRDIHNINGFVIYDNNSTIYTSDELYNELSDLGVKLKVIEYTIEPGPLGKSFEDGTQLWDSDYGYPIMLEHSKLRYLSGAKSVMNLHPDELLVLTEGTIDSIVEDLIQENLEAYTFQGRWVEPYNIKKNESAHLTPMENRSYLDYFCNDSRNLIPAGRKWITIPSRSLNSQWCPHHISGIFRSNDNLYYGHYLSHNTNWAWVRDEYKRDPSGLVVDPVIKYNLEKLIGKI